MLLVLKILLVQGGHLSEFQILVDKLKSQGAKRVFIKPLANNDNSKQQIYQQKNELRVLILSVI